MKKNRYRGLKNISLFVLAALIHIFEGVLENGKASGYHYEGIPNTPGSIVPGTESPLGQLEVYTATPMVNGVTKRGNEGASTFFPKSMTPQQVVDAINEAYQNKRPVKGNLYKGFSSAGMEIRMRIGRKEKILTAYPIYKPLPQQKEGEPE